MRVLADSRHDLGRTVAAHAIRVQSSVAGVCSSYRERAAHRLFLAGVLL